MLQTQKTTRKQAAGAPKNEVKAVCKSVWLGNLHWDLTEFDLRGAVESLFSRPISVHGPIQNAAMHCCYAMVDFATRAEALELLKHCAAPQNKCSDMVCASLKWPDNLHTTKFLVVNLSWQWTVGRALSHR